MRISDWSSDVCASDLKSERPRERLLAHGARVLTSPELLAIVLRTGIQGCDAVSLGHRLLTRFGGLRGLLSPDAQPLLALAEIGRASFREIVCQYVYISFVAVSFIKILLNFLFS